MIDAMAVFLAAAEHHRGGGAHAQRVRVAVHVFPFVGSCTSGAKCAREFRRPEFPRRRRESNRVRHRAGARSCRARSSPETSAMQPISGAEKQCRCTCGNRSLDRAQHIFVKLDAQVRMQAALQQHSGAAQLEHFLDLCRRSSRATACSLPSSRAGGRTRRTSNIRCRNSCS